MSNNLRDRLNNRNNRSNDSRGINNPSSIFDDGKKEVTSSYPYTTSYDKGFAKDNGEDTVRTSPKNAYPNRAEANQTYGKLPQKTSVKDETRTGMSSTAWGVVFTVTEIFLDIIKGVMIVGGIIAANLADFIMGSIGISLIVNTRINTLTFVNGFGFGSILSMGASAIQIYMWSLIQKRGITAKMLLTPSMWGSIPKDIRGFLAMAFFLWIIDTLLDVSPTIVLFTQENFLTMPWLYYILVGSVMIIVTILCGFAEILTSNMRAMLSGSK